MENQKNYRITKHQSELAVRVVGSSQADLFANSALTLFDVMVTDVAKSNARSPFLWKSRERIAMT
jgi:SHS2 domain-containing protein